MVAASISLEALGGASGGAADRTPPDGYTFGYTPLRQDAPLNDGFAARVYVHGESRHEMLTAIAEASAARQRGSQAPPATLLDDTARQAEEAARMRSEHAAARVLNLHEEAAAIADLRPLADSLGVGMGDLLQLIENNAIPPEMLEGFSSLSLPSGLPSPIQPPARPLPGPPPPAPPAAESRRDRLPDGLDVVEMGRRNFWGDMFVPMRSFTAAIRTFGHSEEEVDQLVTDAGQLLQRQPPEFRRMPPSLVAVINAYTEENRRTCPPSTSTSTSTLFHGVLRAVLVVHRPACILRRARPPRPLASPRPARPLAAPPRCTSSPQRGPHQPQPTTCADKLYLKLNAACRSRDAQNEADLKLYRDYLYFLDEATGALCAARA